MKAERYVLSSAAVFVLALLSPAAFGSGQERPALGKIAGRLFREFEHIASIAGADAHSGEGSRVTGFVTSSWKINLTV